MKQTEISIVEDNVKKQKIKRIILALGLIFIGLILIVIATFFYYLRPKLEKTMGDKLDLKSNPARVKIEAYYEAEESEKAELIKDLDFPSNLEAPPLLMDFEEDGNPVCGKDKSWIFLLVGVDYRGQDYLYGLADVIRVIRFDFINKTMNMVAIPRDTIIEMPQGTFLIESPMKINQAYLTGTAGWTGKIGEGNGAVTLAQAIDYNFGIASEHYMVVNFDAVEEIIDAVGGVEVDLPEPVYDEAWGGFPAGVQLLDGERALDLMRIRAAYSDEFRVENQTLILKSLFSKLKKPEMLLKIPELVNHFSENILTDLDPETMISLGTCFLTKFDISTLKDFQIDQEFLISDSVYIPSLGGNSFVYRWDDQTVQFIHSALMQK